MPVSLRLLLELGLESLLDCILMTARERSENEVTRVWMTRVNR